MSAGCLQLVWPRARVRIAAQPVQLQSSVGLRFSRTRVERVDRSVESHGKSFRNRVDVIAAR